MGEQRFQAYVKAILQANAALVDMGQVAQALGLETSIPQGTDASAQFLRETLQLIVDKKGNPQQIYPLWAKQQAQFNPELLAIMPTVAARLFEGNAERRTFIATIFAEFGNLIQQFSLGERWLNLELAIAAYEHSLQIINCENMPVEWAQSMTNLATAYYSRTKGNRAKNLEVAIHAYEQSLQVMSRDSMPIEWAQSMTNLAIAYYSRTKGDRTENLENAIRAYKQSLQVRTRETMPTQWAQSMMGLALAYCSRSKGDHAENCEEAIQAYEQLLQVMTRETMPTEWAQSMNNLATVYLNRVRGERAENIENAIRAYKQSLQIMTREAMPVEWAQSMTNLALAYYSRTQGDRAENLENAICAYKQSLEVRNRKVMPIEWAQSMMGLANSYSERILGNHVQNIEDAILAYEQAMQIRTRQSMPLAWAASMNNLAAAYHNRILGDRAQNIEEAINAYQQSLQVRTREVMPIDWAQTMMNLANAYYSRIRGERVKNIEDAIYIYKQSLEIITFEMMPIEWAKLMNNLATAYSERTQGGRVQNIEDAIAAYQQSLQVRAQDAMPVEWATSMDNLATAYLFRIRGDREQNIEDAIAAYQQSLQVRTQDTMPIKWSQSMNNLALAYSNRIRGNRAQNIETAISAYQQALENLEPTILPDHYRRSSRLLANLYSNQQRWSEAALAYQKSLLAAETLYESAILLDSKTAELSATANMPCCAAYALARIGDLSKAVEVLEQGRARGLSESLERDRANLTQLEQTAPGIYQQYQTITAQLRNLESQQRNISASDQRHSLTLTELHNTASALRNQLNQTITEIRRVEGYTGFLVQPSFEDIRATLRLDSPLVYLVTTPNGSMSLIFTVDKIDVLWLDDLTGSQLADLLNQTWFAAYRQPQTNRQAWYDEINTVTRQLWHSLMGPLIQKLQALNLTQATLIPTGYLSLLPLHAAWTEDLSTPTGRRYALDHINFTYAPNAQSLTAAQAISDRVYADSILAIDNPRNDLPNSEQEVQAAVSTFLQPTVLRHHQATVDQVRSQLPNATIAHFSCHGTANLTEPLASGMLMSDGLLTLKDIFALNLADTAQGNHGLRLAILSACETGMIGIENADEAISLPTGLLQAGVAAVIASLWSVSDLSTMLLLTRFYRLWRQDGLEPAAALRAAQQWVRDTTNAEKAAYFKTALTAQPNVNTPGSAADYLYKQMLLSRPDQRDFAHPFHWAAFSYTGV